MSLYIIIYDVMMTMMPYVLSLCHSTMLSCEKNDILLILDIFDIF